MTGPNEPLERDDVGERFFPAMLDDKHIMFVDINRGKIRHNPNAVEGFNIDFIGIKFLTELFFQLTPKLFSKFIFWRK